MCWLPGPPAAKGELLHDAELTQAIALVALGRNADAVPPLENYLHARPLGEAWIVAARNSPCATPARAISPSAAVAHGAVGPDAESPVIEPATLALAELCYESKHFAEAAELYSTLLTSAEPDESHAAALAGLAWCEWQQGKLADAEATFARLLESCPSDARWPPPRPSPAHRSWSNRSAGPTGAGGLGTRHRKVPRRVSNSASHARRAAS